MGKYYTTNVNVFGDNQTIDKPSKLYLDTIEGTEAANLNIDMSSGIDLCNTYLDNDTITLIKLVNEEQNRTLYYRIVKFLKFVKNHYLVQCELDYGLTFTIHLFENDINVKVDRHNDYSDENYLMFQDELVETIPKTYSEYAGIYNQFLITDNRGISQNGAGGLSGGNNDILNAITCLVVSDSELVSNSYTLIPILSVNNSVSISQNVVTNGDQKGWINYDISPGNTTRKLLTIRDVNDTHHIGHTGYTNMQLIIDMSKYKANYDEAKKNGAKPYFFIEMNNGGGGHTELTYEGCESNYDLLFKSDLIFYAGNDTFTYLTKGVLCTGYAVELENEIMYISSNANGNGYTGKTVYLYVNEFVVNLNASIPDSSKTTTVYNSYNQIEELIKSPSVSNKILGIYLTPNVLNFYKQFKLQQLDNTGYLTIDMPTAGFNSSLTIFNNSLIISEDYEFNSTKFFFKSLLKYLEFDWVSNIIDVSKLLNDGQITLNMYNTFTNNFNCQIINERLDINNQLIDFNGPQPLKIDTYRQYVNANMNVVNTGYQIQKQQAIFNGISGGLSSLLGGSNPLKTGLSLGTGIAKNVMGVANYERQLRAQYADANNTMGNKLLFGATQDTLYNSQLIQTGQQFDAFKFKNLTDDYVKAFNNLLLLNGVYNPKYFKLNELPKVEQLGFSYALLDSTNFNQILSPYLNVNRAIKEMVFNQLSEFRIWDVVPNV